MSVTRRGDLGTVFGTGRSLPWFVWGLSSLVRRSDSLCPEGAALAQASTKRAPANRAGGSTIQRLKVVVRGAVQGVGFRPFIYRLATEMGLKGWVLNSSSGVFIEVEGPTEKLRSFVLRIETDKPPIAFIQSLESAYLDVTGYRGFEIRASVDGEKTAMVVPDIATCPDCRREIFDSHNRRYLYPFTNCTNCGPRFTIIESLPYDRPRTSMRKFEMCPQCRLEYDSPSNRRFHAQPNACPECGPQLQLVDREGHVLNARHDALRSAAQYIRNGNIVAVKGLGGFHLMCDAASEDAVRMLRRRKNREAKPFALMYPSLEMIDDRAWQSLSWRHAALHAAASPADVGIEVCCCSDEREPFGRADLHRRT